MRSHWRRANSRAIALDSHPTDVPAGEVTELLREINGGNASAPELFSLIYQDLHRLAASYMRMSGRTTHSRRPRWSTRRIFACSTATRFSGKIASNSSV